MIFKKNRISFFNLALTFVLLQSCVFNNSGCKKLSLSDEERTWFTPHKNGKVIFYKSELGEIDTFEVEVDIHQKYTSCNKFELGEYIYGSLYCNFHSLDNYSINNSEKDFYIGFDKVGQDKNDLECNKTIIFFELTTHEFINFSKFPQTNIKLPFLKDSIIEYQFTRNKEVNHESNQYQIMKEFYVTKEYGLIRYKTINGHIYERVW